MEYRNLGKTGLRVSEIGYGAAQIGNINLPESQADRALNAVLDAGINFIDTAAMYGQSEARIGKFISHRREEFVLATKCGDYVAESNGKRGIVRDYSRDGILRTIDDSRKKLDMDVIDIVQFHGLPEPADDEQVAFEALLDAREKGWTRFIGVSADGPSAAAAARRWDLDTQEFTYNILYQESAENLMPTLRSLGMGTIIKRPISNAVWQQSERPRWRLHGRTLGPGANHPPCRIGGRDAHSRIRPAFHALASGRLHRHHRLHGSRSHPRQRRDLRRPASLR